MNRSRYFRLATPWLDRDSRRESGLFTHAYELLDDPTTPRHAYDRLYEAVVWFERNLPIPDRSLLTPLAIFWFQARAGAMIRRFWGLAAVLRELDHDVQILKTSRPGYVLYEDDFQVGAVPFQDTFRLRRRRRAYYSKKTPW